MIRLTLSASLAKMLPADLFDGTSTRFSLSVDASSWPETVEHIAGKFTRLSKHAFDDSGQLRSGLLVAVNDRVIPGGSGHRPDVRDGDEVFLFTQIAGG